MRRSLVTYGIIFVLSFSFFNSQLGVEGQSSQLLPSSLAIGGTIIDNYANITHTYVFDNSDSTDNIRVEFQTGTPNGMYLSNVSVSTGGENFWGQVYTIEEAQDIFDDAVEQNQSAVLVTKVGSNYQFEVNVKAGDTMTLVNYFEGYLTRRLGTYYAELYNPVTLKDKLVHTMVDVLISSTGSDILRARPNLSEYERISHSNGKQILIDIDNFLHEESLTLEYTMNQLDFGGKLLTHSNGTDNFFLYMLAPEIYEVGEIESREFIFVLDVSGSMSGEKIEQAKSAFATMIETLNTNDMFNVISFNNDQDPLWTNSQVATTGRVDEAVDWVLNLDAGGGTNINGAMLTALDSFVGESTAQVVTLLSDGQGSNPANIVRQNVMDANNETSGSLYRRIRLWS